MQMKIDESGYTAGDVLKAIEALSDALGYSLVRNIDRYEVSSAMPDAIFDPADGKYYKLRVWYECIKHETQD